MQLRPLLLTLLGLCLLAGCSNGMGRRYYERPTDLALQQQVQVNSDPNVEKVIAHLNQHASTIKALEAQDLTITVNEGGLNSYTARGWLFYQKPRGFRLQAEALRSTEADIGSNDDEFWFWFKRNNPPALYHCAYSDYARLQNLNLPVHPDWVAEALGVQELPHTTEYRLRQVKNGVELVSTHQTASGHTLFKVVTVGTTGPWAGYIRQQRLVQPQVNATGGPLLDKKGQRVFQDLWVATIDEYQNIDGYVVPRWMTLRSPKDKLTLELKLDGCQVNPRNLMTKSTGNTFVRPAGYEEVNLGQALQAQTTQNPPPQR